MGGSGVPAQQAECGPRLSIVTLLDVKVPAAALVVLLLMTTSSRYTVEAVNVTISNASPRLDTAGKIMDCHE